MYARPKVADEEYDARKAKLRQLLCLTQKGIDELVANYPEALNLDIDGNIMPKLEMLQRRLGIDQKGAGHILKAKRLIGTKKETLEARVNYLQNDLDLSDEKIAKLLVANPDLLARSIKNHYEPLFNALQTSFGFTQEEIVKLAMKNAQVLYRPSVEKVESTSCFLPNVLGLSVDEKEGLKKCLLKCPSLLTNTESNLKESNEWILNLVGNSQSVAGRVCRNRPDLLGYSVDLLQDKVDWYRDRLSLTEEEFRKVVATYPTIMALGIEDGKMDKKLCHIQQLFDINDKELKELFLSRPELFVLSAEKNIEPKLELYGSLIGKERTRKLVVESPYLLLWSMKRVITPRLEEVDRAYEYVEWTETLLRRLVLRKPKRWCDYMLDDAPRAKGEKLDDSGKYKRFVKKR